MTTASHSSDYWYPQDTNEHDAEIERLLARAAGLGSASLLEELDELEFDLD